MLPTIFSGGDDLIVIVVAFVVLFGGSQLPKLAKNTGEALREFRKAHSEAEAGSHDAAAPAVAPGAVAPLLPAAPPVATAVTQTQTAAVPQAASASSASGDFVTLTRSQLDALLAEREAQAHAEAPKAAG